MARVFPFRPYRFSAKAGDPQNLVTQPYDKIPPDWQERYYQASPHNVIRLIKGKSEPSDSESSNVYTRAAATLNEWIAQGILTQDGDDAFYPYFQEFAHPDSGEIFIRKGFIGLLGLEEYEAGVMHRHELTHSGPKLDRLQLTRHTHCHFGQLFVLYDDKKSAIDALIDNAAQGEPILNVSDEYDVRHRVWKISDPDAVARIRAIMTDTKLMIADGHHRYETALAFKRENPDLPGADRVMMTFVNMHSPGLVVLATHRALSGLESFDPEALLARAGDYFTVEKKESPEALQAALDALPSSDLSLGIVHGKDAQAALLTPRADKIAAALTESSDAERSLDVVVLHKVLLGHALGISEEDVRELKNISYIRGFQAAVDEVRAGNAQVAFLLRPVDVAKVAEISFSGGVMPQKSTDFFPKLLSGITIYRFG